MIETGMAMSVFSRPNIMPDDLQIFLVGVAKAGTV